jgi:transcriptional regulator with XRE-family HTH domain
MTTNTIGARIAKARHDIGLSRRQVAAQVGVNASTVEAWELGRAAPRANKLQTLCGLLNVSVAWLLEGESELFDRNGASGDPVTKIAEKLRRARAMQTELSALLEEVAVEVEQVKSDGRRKGGLAA